MSDTPAMHAARPPTLQDDRRRRRLDRLARHTPAAAADATENRAHRRRKLGSREEVAEYLGVPVATLVAWAYKRTGPPYKIIGRHARYDWGQVDSWVAAQATGGGEVA